MSLRATQLQKIPISRTDYRLGYHMDLDFGLRCQKAGMRAKFDPLLQARHEYSRTVKQFMRDRAASAADRAIIHRLHSDIIGSLPESFFRDGASFPVRLALRFFKGSISILAERILEVAALQLGDSEATSYVQEFLCDFLERLRGQRIADDVNRIFDQQNTQTAISSQRIFANLSSRK